MQAISERWAIIRSHKSVSPLVDFAPVAITLFGVLYSLYWSLASGPVTMQDELVYKLQSRDGVLSNDIFGNFLHSVVFESVVACGPAFYSCAKVINSLFFVIFIAGIFGFASLFLTRQLSWWVAAVTSVSGVSAYTTVFMPEMMYASLLVLSLLLGAKAYRSGAIWLYGSVVVLVLASLTKPHAVLFLPGFLILWALAGAQDKSISLRMRTLVVSSLAFVGLRSLLGFALAGVPGLSPIPVGYGGPGILGDLGTRVIPLITNDISFPMVDGDDKVGVFDVFLSHTVASFLLLVMLGGPLIVLALRSVIPSRNADGTYEESHPTTKLVFSSLMIIGNGMAIGVLSGAYFFENQGEGFESRLMFRYWDFLIPILAVIGIWFVQQVGSRKLPVTGLVLISVSAAAYVFSISGFLYQFDFSYTDGAVVRSAASSFVFVFLLILAVGLGILMFFPGLAKIKLGIVVASVSALAVVMIPNWPVLAMDSSDARAVASGDYLRTSKLSPDSNVAIVASSNFEARATYFLSGLDDASLYFAPTGAVIPSEDLLQHDFLLIAGTLALEDESSWRRVSEGAGFAFFEALRANQQSFGIGKTNNDLVLISTPHLLTPDGLVATEINLGLRFLETVRAGTEVELSLSLPTTVPDRVVMFEIDGEKVPLELENSDDVQSISFSAPADLDGLTVSSSLAPNTFEDGFSESNTGLVLHKIRIGGAEE